MTSGPGTRTISMHHVPRVEGHGTIEVRIRNGRLDGCTWVVSEAPRYFERMLRGKPYTDAAEITSRICGICGVGHTMASVQATEAAMRVPITEQTRDLRVLCVNGATLQSHVLHVGVLVAPDLLGADDVLTLVRDKHPAAGHILTLKKLGNELCDLIGGRTTHPITVVVGGMTSLPSRAALEAILKRFESARHDADALAGFLAPLLGKQPRFGRVREFISLTHPCEYALYDGSIASGDPMPAETARYLEFTNEYRDPASTALFCSHNGKPYMVGALARYHHNFTKLHPRAHALAATLGLVAESTNPYDNNAAQLVECVHVIEDTITRITRLLDHGLDPHELDFRVRPQAGYGVGAHEVPRGILYHAYEYDERGFIVKADAVIPTNQNHACIQNDFEAYIPQLFGTVPEDRLTYELATLVRAYDPCISCSVHKLVRVRYV